MRINCNTEERQKLWNRIQAYDEEALDTARRMFPEYLFCYIREYRKPIRMIRGDLTGWLISCQDILASSTKNNIIEIHALESKVVFLSDVGVFEDIVRSRQM